MGTRGERSAPILQDLLEQLRVQQQSGILRVRRTDHGQVEEGAIWVSRGHLSGARVGSLTGQDALSKLRGWSQAQYQFVTEASRAAEERSRGPASGHETFVERDGRSAGAGGPASRQTGGDQSSVGSSSSKRHQRIPRRQRQEGQVMELPLTRPQRQVYQLVDGERTIADLARCLCKTGPQIEWLLADLQEQDLISFSTIREEHVGPEQGGDTRR